MCIIVFGGGDLRAGVCVGKAEVSVEAGSPAQSLPWSVLCAL